MNLGEISLRTVNASRPQLVHASSKQSVTASDDYYSLVSDDSSTDDHTTIRYQTPPSHLRSAASSRDLLQPEATAPSPKPVNSSPLGHASNSTVVKFTATSTVKGKSSSGERSRTQKAADSDISPATPGLDDTPYIRFAIDQLTRDEELPDIRKQGAPSEDSYPVERIVPDEGLGYYGHSQRSTRHERQPSDPTIALDDVFIPVEPPTDLSHHSKLNCVPGALRPLSLMALILCCLLMIAALIFCNIRSSQHSGLLKYDGVGSSRYFLFQFLPQILAMIIILWLLIIQRAIQRILPFSILSAGHDTPNSNVFNDAALFPTNPLIPNLACFKLGEPMLGLCHLVFWLSLFTVPLQSALFQTRYYAEGQAVWRWTAVRPVGWTLLVLYVLLALALMLLLLRFLLHQTGLKWDPVSLADIFALFSRSNILYDFEGSEIPSSKDGPQAAKTYRLGYWTTSKRPSEVFYAIGEENARVRRYSSEEGKMKANAYAGHNIDLEGQRPVKTVTSESLHTNIHSPNLRYRWVPWFLKDTFVVAWIVIAIILTLAFVIISFVNQAVQKGFLPLLPAPTTPLGFSPANFLYSFVPSLIGMLLFLLWQPIDTYHRALMPFANLAIPGGATAEHSLLLDYNASLPFAVSVKAALVQHYKVAWISLVGIISATIPVLAGGVFTALFFLDTQDVRIAACMPAYIALVVFVTIYALSFLVIWPGRKRHLPHDIRTLGQLLGFFYASPLLADAAFCDPVCRVDLVTKLLSGGGASAGEGEKASQTRYAFGLFRGRDAGSECLGIDRLVRPESGDMIVATGKMKK